MVQTQINLMESNAIKIITKNTACTRKSNVHAWTTRTNKVNKKVNKKKERFQHNMHTSPKPQTVQNSARNRSHKFKNQAQNFTKFHHRFAPKHWKSLKSLKNPIQLKSETLATTSILHQKYTSRTHQNHPKTCQNTIHSKINSNQIKSKTPFIRLPTTQTNSSKLQIMSKISKISKTKIHFSNQTKKRIQNKKQNKE